MRMLATSVLALILFAGILLVVVDPATWTLRSVSRETYGALVLLVAVVLPWLALVSGMLDRKQPAP